MLLQSIEAQDFLRVFQCERDINTKQCVVFNCACIAGSWLRSRLCDEADFLFGKFTIDCCACALAYTHTHPYAWSLFASSLHAFPQKKTDCFAHVGVLDGKTTRQGHSESGFCRSGPKDLENFIYGSPRHATIHVSVMSHVCLVSAMLMCVCVCVICINKYESWLRR